MQQISDGFFELETLPARTVVVGAGYIAVELAGVLSALGSKVTLMIRHDSFLRTFDHVKTIFKCLKNHLIKEMGV